MEPKRLIVINGTMGAGKSAVGQELKGILSGCAYLDGDWCWDMNPFVVNEETKACVLDNIGSVLNRFLSCPQFTGIVFCWVMQTEDIWQEVNKRLLLPGSWEVFRVTLMCREETLRERLEGDIAAGRRERDVVERSLSRLPLYEAQPTHKVWTDGKGLRQIAEEILALAKEAGAPAPGRESR